MDLSSINFLAVLVATVVYFLIGSIWYSPLLFYQAWKEESGLSDDQIQNANMLKIFGTAILLSFVIALNLATFLSGEPNLLRGVFAGALAGIGWVGAAMGILYLFERKSLKFFMINAGYHAVSFVIVGGILGVSK